MIKYIEQELDRLNAQYGDHAILRGYRIIQQDASIFSKKIKLAEFTDYLLDQVVILRTIIPELADVTHYFDALNNRGEQLEAHEVIKAHFLVC